ncbi:MAG: helicase C-terminal domain-containing protein [Acidimicrobiales bacterium]
MDLLERPSGGEEDHSPRALADELAALHQYRALTGEPPTTVICRRLASRASNQDQAIRSRSTGSERRCMAVNFGAIKAAQAANKLIDPRDIFNALPSKPVEMSFLRGPQDQVLDKWFARRNQRDLVVKLNTGGGKTLVGLLIARSSLAEGKGPVAYLVPDRYLVDQVLAEAGRLGIEATGDTGFAYAQGRAILVETFQKLFNGKSVFGVAGSAGRSPSAPRPHTVIIDDAHACLNKAEQAFRLSIPASNDAYRAMLELFGDELESQAPAAYIALTSQQSSGIQQVPYWAWANKKREVLELLASISNTEEIQFSWPLLADVLPISRAVFTAEALEIEAPCPPASVVVGFDEAERRIYLTATLADDGILVSDLDADPEAMADPITPASAGDIGDRLILVPQQTHPEASEDEVRDLILGLAGDRNVVVIVPSYRRAAYWKPYAKAVLDKDTLTAGIEQMRNDPELGLVVLVNRYDGVDLPGDACHVLVIDGLPEAMSGSERIDQAQLTGSELLVARQVQRLEQGMGRATRSNDDHCVVFLLGRRLAERLYSPEARECFSPATRAQIELSEQVATQLGGTALDTLREAALQCLNRDPEWLTISRTVLAPLRYPPARVSEIAIASREAFNHAAAGDFTAAVASSQRAIDVAPSDSDRGYLMQQQGAYQHHLDPSIAQQTQKAANRRNRNVLRPMGGVEYERLSAPTMEQGAAASSYLQARYPTGNDVVIGLNALIDDLGWGNKSDVFEQAWSDLADHLGFGGQRPERDTGSGPDGLWALTGGSFHVIEAKNQVDEANPVYKKHAEQLSNAMDWFRGIYGTNTRCTPVLIHPRAAFDRKAAIPTGCQVVTAERLASLRDNLRTLTVGLSASNVFRDGAATGRLLATLGLTPNDFLKRYTSNGFKGS